MLLKTMVIGIIVISMIVVGISTIYIDIADNYGVNVHSSNLTTYRNMNDSLDLLRDMENQTNNNILKNIPILGEIAAITMGGVTLISYILSAMPTMFGNMMADMSLIFGLPAEYGWFIQAIITAVILFALLYAMLKIRV